MTPPFYPMRPSNGGPLFADICELTYMQGAWIFQPKINGWRALLHVPSGRMWNRHGQPLSISAEFQSAIGMAMKACQKATEHMLFGDKLTPTQVEWLDVEALERRHNRGRGCLVVLDIPMHGGELRQRMKAMHSMFMPCTDHCASSDMAYSIPSYNDGREVWCRAMEDNRKLGCVFYEGLVAKRVSSPYERQLRSATETTKCWVKHRFTTS